MWMIYHRCIASNSLLFSKGISDWLIKSHVTVPFTMVTQMQITGPNLCVPCGINFTCITRHIAHDKARHANWPYSVQKGIVSFTLPRIYDKSTNRLHFTHVVI